MSNYTETTNFTALTTAHAVINGAAFDLEYGNVATAIASKLDNLTAGYTGPFKMNAAAGQVTLTLNGAAGFSALQVNVTGVQVGAPTGGDQGLGTINVAGGYYVNGVLSGFGSVVVKTVTALESRTSTTVPANSIYLTYAIPGAGTYRIRALGAIATAGTGGLSANLNFSGTSTSSVVDLSFGGGSLSGFGGSIASATTTVQITGNGNSNNWILVADATLIATGAGTVAVAFAQGTSNVSPVSLAVGSTMTVERIA